jgi:hypothetical protein
MKTVLKLSLIAILLLCTTFANGQLADSTLYKVKLEKFQTKAHNGKIVTLVGVGAVVIGGICAIIGEQPVPDPDWPGSSDERSVGLAYVGLGLAAAGIIAIIPGSINWSTGKKKVKEYQIKLDDARTGFYYNPKSVGVTLAFKF